MRLYRWPSDALKNYSQGDILAIGANAEEARANARAQFARVANDRWEWLFAKYPGYALDPDDQEERDAKLAQLEADIAAEPEEAQAFFINGGE